MKRLNGFVMLSIKHMLVKPKLKKKKKRQLVIRSQKVKNNGFK